jgi:hypothetical protein
MRRISILSIISITTIHLSGCASFGDSDPEGAGAISGAQCASIDQLRAWQTEIDEFDGGYRPTGSAAHEAYIARLASELKQLGVSDVHTEPYAFVKWTPFNWSLTLLNGSAAGSVPLTGYVPYSGTTGPFGVTTGMVYVPTTSIPLDAAAIEQALRDPETWKQTLITQLKASFSLLHLTGKIAVFDVPKLVVSLKTLTGRQLLVNDPDGTLSPDGLVSRTDLAAMLFLPAMLDVFASFGAVGAVGILPLPEAAARGEYAPFFGVTTPNVPAVYVDRATGDRLKQAISSNLLQLSTLVLNAVHTPAVSENLIGVLPGASDDEIILGSHTDGPNSMEDNGPVAILALASCLPQSERPRTIRVVLSGGHFVGSLGLQTYVLEHALDLSHHALAVMELEHLGAREWAEVSPGVMGLTGQPEMQLVTTWENPPLVEASKAFAQQFPRSIVATPPVIGEGPNFRIVPLVQFITMPQYLLLGHLPAITSEFTDYELMQRQVTAFRDMALTLSRAPADQLGVPGL